MTNKGQASFEFILIFVLVFLIFIGVVALLTRYVDQSNTFLMEKKVESFANAIENEIYLAYKSPGKFSAKLIIPPNIDGRNFNIGMNSNSNFFYVSMQGNYTTYRSLPNITGNLQKGCNNITKKDGVLSVQGC